MRWTALIIGLGLGSAPRSAAQLSSMELVAITQSHLDRVQDFEAHFTQRYARRIVRKVIEESGVVMVKKPGRMRWDYLSPEQKLFITDSTKSTFYLPEERQVIVSHSPGGALGMGRQSPFSVLAGRSRLVDVFEVDSPRSQPQRGGAMLRLLPRQSQEDFEEVELEVDPGTGRVLRVVLVDIQENETEFVFDRIQENRGLPDSLFVFTIPSGVDIVLASDSSDNPRQQEHE